MAPIYPLPTKSSLFMWVEIGDSELYFSRDSSNHLQKKYLAGV